MNSLESLHQSINELSASIDKNIELLAKQREEISELVNVCEFILRGLDTPEAGQSEWWKAVIEFKLRDIISKTKGTL